ncbi:MAG: class I SAM-dependent methyltransferase [Phycisphaerales bacterium]|nr:class I SAM-dependent methyltransferase [Phycisphaerales bacterium]
MRVDAPRVKSPEQRAAWLAANIASHGLVRSRWGVEPDESGVMGLVSRCAPPAWAAGSVGIADAMMLYDAAFCLRPRLVAEIGTAAGVSACALLLGLHDAGVPLRREDGLTVLHTFDALDRCYFDASRAVGEAIGEMTPDLAHGATVHGGRTAAHAGAALPARSVELAFIDADHRHPMPTGDLLALAPALAPGAWVALHDLALHESSGGREYGPIALFEAWPFEKMRGLRAPNGRPGCANVGLIRLPDRPVVASDVRGALERAWEVRPGTPEARAVERLAA